MQQTYLFIYINNFLEFYFLVKIRVSHAGTATGFGKTITGLKASMIMFQNLMMVPTV
jgi:hypothetical protein